MSMLEQKIADLSKYRIEKAANEIEASQMNLAAGRFTQSISNSYYAIFHSIRAAMALDQLDSKKHSGVISIFRANYVKTGAFSKEISDYIQMAFDGRKQADYEDFYISSKSDATKQLEHARIIWEKAKEYIESRTEGHSDGP
jgi:uncharacterized protein (UPF0332 family)